MDHDCSGYFALISGHLLFKRNYQFASSKAVAWRLITTPYDCLTALIPSKKGRRLQRLRNK